MKLNYLALACAAVMLVPLACDFPYSPEKQTLGEIDRDTTSRIFTVNTGQQICNPSISQDTTTYLGCMLWLNFGGQLMVNNSPSGFTNPAGQHDKLTISDTANNVVWFMELPDDIPVHVKGEIQDPEWSTHPDFVVCLGSDSTKKIWDGYAVRISDKSYLKFNDGKMAGTGTPHIWVDPTATGGGAASNPQHDATTGFVDRESINEFFGTYNVTVAYTAVENNVSQLAFMDYSQATPEPVKLTKPEGRESWTVESALISPDGKWVAFNCFAQLEFYVAYIQALSSGSTPYLVEEDAADPHWWIHPDDASLLYLVYAKIEGSHYVKEDLTGEEVLSTASAGYTVKQQVKLFAGRPAHAGLQFVGEPQRLINLPFKGGLSPDGTYLCTGYANAYIAGLE